MEIKGIVHEIGDTESISEKLNKRELILECGDNPQYLEYVKFEALNDRCDLLDKIREGDSIEVHFNLRGRPWTDKSGKKSYFNSLQLWKIS